jgi:hypothetical protein
MFLMARTDSAQAQWSSLVAVAQRWSCIAAVPAAVHADKMVAGKRVSVPAARYRPGLGGLHIIPKLLCPAHGYNPLTYLIDPLYAGHSHIFWSSASDCSHRVVVHDCSQLQESPTRWANSQSASGTGRMLLLSTCEMHTLCAPQRSMGWQGASQAQCSAFGVV